MKRLGLLVVLAVALLAGIPFARPSLDRLRYLYALSRQPAPTRLPSPVARRSVRFTDTWQAARPGARRHEGIDIFAPKGTPVVSTTMGLVTRVGTNRLGGQIVGVLGPGFEWHYYAHLSGFAAVREGDLVRPGDLLGYVGDTGNARGTPPHLHYGLYRGGALNPYPRLAPPGGQDSAGPRSAR